MANFDYKEKIRAIIRELISESMNEMPGDGYVDERQLTPAEEKKKEKLVKALKPKYGKTPKTYAIATAQAKKLAEEELEFEEISQKEGEIFPPKFGINGSSKFLAVIYKDGEVDDNNYFDSKEEAQNWIDETCHETMDEKLDFTQKFDDNPALTKGQKKLPDQLQKGIINKKLKKEDSVEEEGIGLGFVNKTSHGRLGHEDLPYHARGAKK